MEKYNFPEQMGQEQSEEAARNPILTPLHRRMFGIAREMWDDICDEILHACAAINFGKTHLHELTDAERIRIIAWMEGMAYGD